MQLGSSLSCMRVEKITRALGGRTNAGRRLADLAGRPHALSKKTLDSWRVRGIPLPWREFIQKNYRQLGLKTYDLMDCCES